jgi:hypothetical protein
MHTAQTQLARQLLELAAAIEQHELAIKQELLRAAQAGDTQRIALIVSRWLERPATEVLPGLTTATERQ